MRKIQGTGVSAGIAIGPLTFVSASTASTEARHIEDATAEIERFSAAQNTAIEQLGVLRDKTAKELGESKAELFDTHQLMLQDPDYVDKVHEIITSQQVNAEYAVAQTSEEFAAMFTAMDSDYMKARAADVKDISQRVISVLDGSAAALTSEDGKPFIIGAEELTPSQTAQLDRSLVLGFVNQEGSSNSHTAILARTMGIPAIIGTGDELNADNDGAQIIIDGTSGVVFIDPDEETMSEYTSKKAELDRQRELLNELKGKPSVTSTGQKVRLYANIGRPTDLATVNANDAEGIGLFRSEFLYLESTDFPTEDEQFAAYKQVLEGMDGKEVVIRTLDIGADKQAAYFNLDHEANPALGLRAIRICLTRPEIFKTQLRALYRASAFGKLSIMLPMITAVGEVEQSKKIMAEVRDELASEGVAMAENVPVGIMIETPASVIIADELAKVVDFFSIGTNDLTQYTLACDRQNAKVAQFVDTHHPALLRMIRMTAEAAHAAGIWVGICGELGADPELTATFLDMGIDELSVSAPRILPLRDSIRKF